MPSCATLLRIYIPRNRTPAIPARLTPEVWEFGAVDFTTHAIYTRTMRIPLNLNRPVPGVLAIVIISISIAAQTNTSPVDLSRRSAENTERESQAKSTVSPAQDAASRRFN